MIFYYKANNKVTKPQEKYVPGMGMCWEFTMLPFKDKEEEKIYKETLAEFEKIHGPIETDRELKIFYDYTVLKGLIPRGK